LPVFVDCPFFIVPSVFFNVYLPICLDCPLVLCSSGTVALYDPFLKKIWRTIELRMTDFPYAKLFVVINRSI
jgi:hypothetical protein